MHPNNDLDKRRSDQARCFPDKILNVAAHFFALGQANPISRAQGKKLLLHVTQSNRLVLNFANVDSIGQAFADEVFRVFANARPAIGLVPEHATPEVQQMIRRAQVARDEDHGQLPLL